MPSGSFLAVLLFAPVGEGEPSVGMSPAKADHERTNTKADAIKKRFILGCSFGFFGDARVLTSEKNRAT